MFRQVRRRIPTQERGKRRVEAILDAAAGVFAEVGFDGATIDAIAEKAKSSVGSVYQFFGNKEALYTAVAEECLTRSRRLFEEILTPELLAGSWEDVVATALDAYFEWEQGDTYVRAIYSNLHLYGTFEEADRAMMTELTERTSDLLSLFAPALKPAKRKLVATTVVNATTAFLFIARRAEPREAKKLLAETKLLLLRYLRPYVEGEEG